MSMLISAELATANMPMNGKTLSNGKFGAPAATTWVSADPSSGLASVPTGTSATAVIETRT